MILEPIGIVRSCFGEKFAVPRQPGLCPSAWGTLVFHQQFRSPEAVRGIEGFSHLWLIFGFHETVDQGWRPTVRPPRLGGNQRVGVFASRSTFRPNGLGLSLVRLESVDLTSADGSVLRLGGLDLLDGTPIYDVKPYLAYAEAQPAASTGFAEEPLHHIAVEVSSAAQADFSKLPLRAQTLILEVLALDPRPATQTADEARIFGAALCGCNIRFQITAGICQILAVESANGSGLST
jgi:tRNA (adenine37-N6)-methyltransferase